MQKDLWGTHLSNGMNPLNLHRRSIRFLRMFYQQNYSKPGLRSPLRNYSRRIKDNSLERAIQKVSKRGTPGTHEGKITTKKRRISESLPIKY